MVTLLTSHNAEMNTSDKYGVFITHLTTKIFTQIFLFSKYYWSSKSNSFSQKLQDFIEVKKNTGKLCRLKFALSEHNCSVVQVTPLHAAYSKNHKEVLKELIEKGADTSVKNRDGVNAYLHIKNCQLLNLSIISYQCTASYSDHFKQPQCSRRFVTCK